MSTVKLKTIGVHPLTDALQLHAILDALHSYGLDKYVTVEPKEGYHEIIVPKDQQERTGCALIAYTLKLILKEVMLGITRPKGKKKANVSSEYLLRTVAGAIKKVGDIASGAYVVRVRDLTKVIFDHFERHPALLNGRDLKEFIEPADTMKVLEALLGNKMTQVLSVVKRVIPVLPSLGKFRYEDASVKQWGAQKFDPICGRLVRAGLKLALIYPIRTSGGSYEAGIALVTPSSSVNGRKVWQAQALLRTFRHRWIRGGSSWERAHAVLMLIDALRTSRAFDEKAAGYVIEAVLAQIQGMMAWRSTNDVERVRELHVAGVDHAKYSKGVAVVTESMMPSHKALRLAMNLELLGGSVDWFVDGFVRRCYRVRREGGWVLNHTFTSNVVKAVTGYDVESLYLALREASVRAGERKDVLISDPYQLERLVAAIESLAEGSTRG